MVCGAQSWLPFLEEILLSFSFIKVLCTCGFPSESLRCHSLCCREGRAFHSLGEKPGVSKLKMFLMFSLPCRNGYNMWRDAFKPTQILDSLCKKNSLPAAEYRREEVKVDNKIFKVPPEAFPEGTECSENNDLSFKQLPVVSSACAGEMVRGLEAHQPLCPQVSHPVPRTAQLSVSPRGASLVLSGPVSVGDSVVLGEDVIQAVRSQSGFPGSGWSKVNPLVGQGCAWGVDGLCSQRRCSLFWWLTLAQSWTSICL